MKPVQQTSEPAERQLTLKSIKANSELPLKDTLVPLGCFEKSKFPANTSNNGSQNVSTLLVGLTTVLGLTLLGTSPDLGTDTIIESCKQIVTNIWTQALQIKCCDLFQTACQITGLITAPLPQTMMLITSIKGETCLCQHFQVDSPTPCNVCHRNEQHTRKIICANRQLRQKFHNHRQH